MRLRKTWTVRLRLLGLSLLAGAALILLTLLPAYGQDSPKAETKKPWTGMLANGREITQGDLDQILQEHALWLKSEGKEGEQADLSGAKLKKANLSGAKLSRADLRGVDLFMANLSRADLSKANLFEAGMNSVNLSWANLRYANLVRAVLFAANLRRANLSMAKLSRADLRRADLSEAYLYDTDLKEADCGEANFQVAVGNRTNLHKAYLRGANLSRTNLVGVDLSGAFLQEANLSTDSLGHANLSEAFLLRANLRGAGLHDAKLNRADLREADLSKADLKAADLSEANFGGASLSETKFNGAKVNGAIFEPKPGTLPELLNWLGVKGFSALTYRDSSYALVDLREAYKKAGMREQERELTYALNHNRRVKLWEKGDPLAKVESLFSLVCFEWTCGYGMTPGRPLKIIGLGLLFFSFPYMLALGSRKRDIGIWILLLPDRVLDRGIKDRPYKLTTRALCRSLACGWRVLRIIRLGFYFSLLSAFSLGWRELNVGNWISRIQKREYTLRATGWVRSVAGLQSLLSVYMLALWVLSYFGQPFD